MPAAKAKKYRALLLCCGHMDRGDDAIGPLCASALEDRKIPVRNVQGETSELLDAWQQAERVIVVDAISSHKAAPGTLIRIDSEEAAFQPEAARCSTHGLGLAQAVKLGRVLKCLPEKLILMGVEAENFDWASTLSPQVAAAMPALLDAIEAEWRKLTTSPARARR